MLEFHRKGLTAIFLGEKHGIKKNFPCIIYTIYST